MILAANFPHGSHGPRDQDQEQALDRRMGGQVLFGNLVFPFASITLDHGDTVGFGKGPQAAAEAARHADQMSVIQLLVRAVPQPAPPRAETTGRMQERVVGVQHDPIHTIVAAFEKRMVTFGQRVRHGWHPWGLFPTEPHATLCHAGSEDRATLASDLSAVASDHRQGQGVGLCPFLFCPHGPESDKRKLAEYGTAKFGAKPHGLVARKGHFFRAKSRKKGRNLEAENLV